MLSINSNSTPKIKYYNAPKADKTNFKRAQIQRDSVSFGNNASKATFLTLTVALLVLASSCQKEDYFLKEFNGNTSTTGNNNSKIRKNILYAKKAFFP